MQEDIKQIFSEIKSQGKRLLAIDFGVKRIGLAHSDYDFKIGEMRLSIRASSF